VILNNVHIVGNGLASIDIEGDRIITIQDLPIHDKNRKEPCIDFESAIAFPGLINSHDHLDFNLFPLLGNKVYQNYQEWGSDIHAQNGDIISEVLKIPKAIRIRWGLYKNLLNGITTVVQHGDLGYIPEDVIKVLTNSQVLHSVRREPNWILKLNNPFRISNPVVIHIGEGTDRAAYDEIDELIRWNLMRKKIIGIHGISMDQLQAGTFEALVWCPVSNLFLMGRTAAIDQLRHKTRIVFGTDSTISAGWNLWDHLRIARNTQQLSDEELYDSITTTPAQVWKQHQNGALLEGNAANVVVAAADANSGMNLDPFYKLNPEDILLVVCAGTIRLFDDRIVEQMPPNMINDYSKVLLNGHTKYLIGDLVNLLKTIHSISPGLELPIKPVA